MIAKRIARANAYPGAPKNWKPERDGECTHLAVRVLMDGDRIAWCESAWEPTPRELEMIMAGGQIVLRVAGWQVPVALYVELVTDETTVSQPPTDPASSTGRIARPVCEWHIDKHPDGECDRCGGVWHNHQRPKECMEPQR